MGIMAGRRARREALARKTQAQAQAAKAEPQAPAPINPLGPSTQAIQPKGK